MTVFSAALRFRVTNIGPFFVYNKKVEFSCLGSEVEFKTLKGSFLDTEDFEKVFKILKRRV